MPEAACPVNRFPASLVHSGSLNTAFDLVKLTYDTSSAVHSRSSPDTIPDSVKRSLLTRTFTTRTLDPSSFWRFETGSCKQIPRPTPWFSAFPHLSYSSVTPLSFQRYEKCLCVAHSDCYKLFQFCSFCSLREPGEQSFT